VQRAAAERELVVMSEWFVVILSLFVPLPRCLEPGGGGLGGLVESGVLADEHELSSCIASIVETATSPLPLPGSAAEQLTDWLELTVSASTNFHSTPTCSSRHAFLRPSLKGPDLSSLMIAMSSTVASLLPAKSTFLRSECTTSIGDLSPFSAVCLTNIYSRLRRAASSSVSNFLSCPPPNPLFTFSNDQRHAVYV